MKLAIIQPRISYFVGGGEITPTKHIEYLTKLGHEVLLCTTLMADNKKSFIYQGLQAKKIPNLQIEEFEVPEKFKYLYEIEAGQDRNRWDIESLMFNGLVYDFLNQYQPDLILNYYILDGLFKPNGIPNILYLLGYPANDLETRKSFLKFYDATISISNNVKNKWGLDNISSENNCVLHTGVDLDVVTNKIIKKNQFDLVYAGRLIERKGLSTLIDSFNEVIKKYPDSHLWVLGDGPAKNDFINQTKTLKLQDKISFLGVINNVSDYFKLADICIFPSYEKEGLMGVVLESMSVGSAIISTKNNGNEDIIEDGVSGLLIEPKNTTALTSAIIKLLNNPKLRQNLGSKAMDYSYKNLSWQISSKKLSNFLEKVLKNHENIST